MSKMNLTETKAYNWLISKGYNQKEIIFQKNKTPDFLVKDNKGYEIKKLYGNNIIWFYDNQIDILTTMENVNIVVFNGGDYPISEFSSKRLSNENIIDGIKISLAKRHLGINIQIIDLTDEEYLELKRYFLKSKKQNWKEFFIEVFNIWKQQQNQ